MGDSIYQSILGGSWAAIGVLLDLAMPIMAQRHRLQLETLADRSRLLISERVRQAAAVCGTLRADSMKVRGRDETVEVHELA